MEEQERRNDLEDEVGVTGRTVRNRCGLVRFGSVTEEDLIRWVKSDVPKERRKSRYKSYT